MPSYKSLESMLETVDTLRVIKTAMDLCLEEAIANNEEFSEETKRTWNEFLDILSYHVNRALSANYSVADRDINSYIRKIQELYEE